MANLYQQSPCRHANRGCDRVLTPGNRLWHLQECAFAPVRCSHEGCQATVNREDLISHQQTCEFRSVTCDDCRETMRQREYENHICVLPRELTEVTRMLRQQVRPSADIHRSTTQGQQHGRGLIQFEATQVQQVVTQRLTRGIIGQPTAMQRQLTGPNFLGATSGISNATQIHATVNKQIFVAGGRSKSHEVFDWSTQKWTLHEDSLFFDHQYGFSFVYDNKIMICGGTSTNRVEYLDITDDESVSTFPVQLPTKCGKGVLYGDEILTFGQCASATSLKPPFRTTIPCDYFAGRNLSGHGVAYVNENTVVVLGGWYYDLKNHSWGAKDDVFLYNPTTKRVSNLAPLPYKLYDMAVVVHKDNLIILGGYDDRGQPVDSVLMYNVTNQHCRKLPKMLQKRSQCAAVIMGDTIVAIGGQTAEYLVLGERTWKELPKMNENRSAPTAVVLP